MESKIKRFMDLKNLGLKVGFGNEKYNKLWNRVCVHLVVYNKESLEIEYNQNHCYNIKGRRHDSESKLHIDDVRYEEGNTIFGVEEGALKYLGDNNGVKRYFENIARQIALDKLNEEREN
jgi:hypothetical protein